MAEANAEGTMTAAGPVLAGGSGTARGPAPAPAGGSPPAGGSLPAVDGADPLVLLDEQVIAQLLRRARLARHRQRERREARLPATELAEENAMLRRYSAVLGEPGVAIALALLALSNRLAHEPEPGPGPRGGSGVGPAAGPAAGPGPAPEPGSEERGPRGGALEMPLPRGQR